MSCTRPGGDERRLADVSTRAGGEEPRLADVMYKARWGLAQAS